MKHGLFSTTAIAERKQFRTVFRNCREVVFATKRVFWETRHKRQKNAWA